MGRLTNRGDCITSFGNNQNTHVVCELALYTTIAQLCCQAADGSLIVNATGARDAAMTRTTLLGAVYTCHVTNGMTSDSRQVRLGYDVIAGAPPLSWMSVKSVTGTHYYCCCCYYYYCYYYTGV